MGFVFVWVLCMCVAVFCMFEWRPVWQQLVLAHLLALYCGCEGATCGSANDKVCSVVYFADGVQVFWYVGQQVLSASIISRIIERGNGKGNTGKGNLGMLWRRGICGWEG
jgi:hypothetical protein